MFYLEKCENCDRSGSVALEKGDTLCNLCKGENKKTKKVTFKKDEEE